MCCPSLSHVYKRSRIYGFCKTYHHVLSILKSHVYKRSGISGFRKRSTMCCLSLSLVSTNVAGFLVFAKSITMVLSIFRPHVHKRSRISGFRKTYHNVLSILKSHVCKRTRTRIVEFCKTYHHVLSILKSHVYKRSRISSFLQNVSPCVVYLYVSCLQT